MPAQSANEKNPLDEVIDVLEPHAGVVRLSAVVFAFLFVGFSIFYSQVVLAGLLPPWTNSTNIGSATGGSDFVYSSSDFDINANGVDIWGTSDSFRFGYQNAPAGDFEIVTKINSLGNTDPWAKAGLMVRASTAANSPHLFVFTTPGSNGVNFQGRTSVGVSSQQYANAPASAFPKWLKIKRVGANYTVYYSTNGTNFTQLGPSKTLNASTPLVGVAVTSHVQGVLTKASFKETKVTSLAAPVPVTPVVPNVKTFTVSSPTYLGGGTSVIWDATGVASCSVVSSPNIWGGSVGTTGSKLVYPTQATSFTLTCYNANGLAVTLPLIRTTTVKPACNTADINAPIINSHLYQISGQTQTYIIQNCAKRWITSTDVFNNVCRYDAARVEHPLSGYLNNVSRGADVTATSGCPDGPKLPPPCSGSPILGLNGSESNITVDVGAQVTVNVRGLSNCTSADTAYINTNSTPGSVWNPDGQWLTSCTLSAGGTCSIAVTLPSSFTPGGPYSTRIRLDRGTNGSIDSASSNVVTINVKQVLQQPAPNPGSEPPYDPSNRESIGKYIEWYVGGKNVTKKIWGIDVNYGQFLYGMAGCESGWTPSEYAGPPYHEKGLYQYQAWGISGYPNSLYNTWGNLSSASRLGSDIWNYKDQVRVTGYAVSPEGEDNPGAWSCWKYWYYYDGDPFGVYRDWSDFIGSWGQW